MVKKLLAALLGSAFLIGAAVAPTAFAGDETKKETPKEEQKK